MSTLDVVALTAAVSRLIPDVAEVTDVEQMSGGASREVWAFTAHDPQGPSRLVLRRDPPGRAPDSAVWAAIQIDRTTEHEVLAAAYRAGLPVPEPLGALLPQDGLGAGLVMARVSGQIALSSLLTDPALDVARPTYAAACGEVLARLQALDPVDVHGLPQAEDSPPHRLWRDCGDATGLVSPALELAYQWLDETAPALRAPVLVHGDFRLGNLVFDEHGLVSVIDWEAAHLGQPGEDVGWFWAPAHAASRPVRSGAVGTVDDFLDAYARGGAVMSEAELLHWRVLAAVRWTVLTHMMGQLHTSGTRRSLELAAVGRRLCEQEWTVLQLLELAA